MPVRVAVLADLERIRALPFDLGGLAVLGLSRKRLKEMLASPEHLALVYAAGTRCSAFLVLHFLPGRRVKGSFAIVTYFSAAMPRKDWAVAAGMEAQAVELARENAAAAVLCRGCGKSREFLRSRGYAELSSHFVKNLSYPGC